MKRWVIGCLLLGSSALVGVLIVPMGIIITIGRAVPPILKGIASTLDEVNEVITKAALEMIASLRRGMNVFVDPSILDNPDNKEVKK